MEIEQCRASQEKKEKKHYSWWAYIRDDVVRKYPERQRLELHDTEQREQEAVQAAIDATERMEDGENRLKVIRLMHWYGAYTLQGAALQIHCSRSLAAKWQHDFFVEVARHRDLPV